MASGYYEDMGRKAQWFREIHGSEDRVVLEKLRDRALEHVELMRQGRTTCLDPGGGAIAKAAVLVGDVAQAEITEAKWPGYAAGCFVTSAVGVSRVAEGAAVTLKQRLARGAQTKLDPRTARLFRHDPERESWVLVDASGWNAQDKYVWGRIDRPGIYAAVALPKEPTALRRLGLESFARRAVRDAVAGGHFASVLDFAGRGAFRDYYVERHHLDVKTTEGARRLDMAQQAQRAALRELGRDWEAEPLGGNPQWAVLDDVLLRFTDLRAELAIEQLLPFWPVIARVANRVGPWFPMGPLNINGRVKSLAMHPTNSDVLFAGAANGGVWKSTNGGDSWRATWKFEGSLAIGAVACAPSNGNVVYAGTGEDTPGYGPSYGGIGVLKSSDGGGTWESVATAAQVGTACNKIVIHPSSSGKLWVASDTGVHYGVRTQVGIGLWEYVWTKQLTGRATDLVVKHGDPSVMLAGIHNSGIFKSTNGGQTWARLEGDRVAVFAIIIAFRENMPTGGDAGWIKLALGQSGEGGADFVVAKLGPNSATTLISGDMGEGWLKTPGSVGVRYDEWCSMVAVHPRQLKHIYLASVGMQHSFDGWNYADSPGTHSDHHQMVFHHTNDNVAYVCCDGGVYRTTDNGTSWQLRSRNLTATQLMSLGVSADGPLVVGSATQDQGIIQTDGSMNWVDHGGGNEWGMFVVDPNDSAKIFISPGGGQLRRSTNRGVSYSLPTNGLTDWWAAQGRNTVAASFAHVAVKPGDGSVIVGVATVSDEVKDANDNVTATYAAKHRIYYSTNGGVDWSIALDLPHRGSRVAFSPSDPSRVYVATSQGRVYRSSSSGSGGWTEPASAANRPPAQRITSIAVDPFNKNRVYITYGGVNPHIYRSTDGGATWNPCNGSDPAMQLPDIALLDVLVDTESPDVLYVASDIGVFRSNDRGATWYWANDSFEEFDLPRVPVTQLGLHPGTHRLYAATMGRGLYYTQASGIISMRATHVRLAHEFPQPMGILKLRLTDGARTYTMTRLEVIRRIQAGTEVYTLAPDGTRTRVRTLMPDAAHPQEYLSTAPDGTTSNNLLSLPRFYG
ncbi:hypothetical protein RA210_U140041 [Rubrivivax sp. A210]|uniref:DUF3892 domain-containing protein n=1 Tax=Rubrivivax sp. A210 TaxID=2772301 RepID=UPI00191926FB|nr:DUF3892 domain-containing protein [Rubrivivax sp. A210]CAD5371045.1 hypothetical protein RA210_U140041 [Rubrivivax sp. A210]